MTTDITSRQTRRQEWLRTLVLLAASLALSAPGQSAPFTLSATTPGGGAVIPAPASGSYTSNQLVTVTAIPANGWTFMGWQGDASGTNPILNFTMTRSLCVQAIFGTPVPQSITPSGATFVRPQVALYPYGTTVKLAAQPQPGFAFVSWTDAVAGTQNPRIYSVVEANPSVAAVFQQLPASQYALTVIPEGLGRVTVTPQTNRYASTEFATLTAVPDPGQTFTGWSGNALGNQNPLMIAMDRHRIVTANFTRHPRVDVVSCQVAASTLPFTLAIAGELGLRYEVQRSTNYVSWTAMGLVTNRLGTAQWTDSTQSGLNQAYYRAVLAP